MSDDVAEQARQALSNLAVILEDAGASFHDVIRTGIYLTDPAHYGPPSGPKTSSSSTCIPESVPVSTVGAMTLPIL